MRFCTSCGQQLEDATIFCVNCGSKLDPPTEQAATNFQAATDFPAEMQPQGWQAPMPTSPYPQYQQNYVQSPAYGQNGQIPASSLIKKHGSSPLFLVGIILFTASIVLSVLVVFMPSANPLTDITGTIEETLAAFPSFLISEDVVEGISGFLDDFDNTARRANYFSLPVFQVLICIGLWLIYAACANRQSPSVKTVGVSLVKGVHIFIFVLSLIGVAALAVIGVVLPLFVGDFVGNFIGDFIGDAPDTTSFVLPFIIIFVSAAVIALGFILLYFLPLFKLIKGVKACANGQISGVKLGVFFPVIIFITSGFTALSSLLSFSTLRPLPVLSSLASATAGILMCIAYLAFRSDLRRTGM